MDVTASPSKTGASQRHHGYGENKTNLGESHHFEESPSTDLGFSVVGAGNYSLRNAYSTKIKAWIFYFGFTLTSGELQQ